MLCAEWCLVKRTHPGLTVIPLRCRCWTCEECRPRRIAQLISLGLAGAPNIFVTLTSRYRQGGDPHAAARALVRAFRQVRQEFLQTHGKHSWPFLCVIEATKNGWPHLHIIGRANWIDQKWLSRRMRKLINSPVVGVERPKRQGRVAYYITKYVGKNPHRFEGTKRYWRSQDYVLPSKDTDQDDNTIPACWQVVQMHWLTYVLQTEELGFSAKVTRSQATLFYGHPP